MAHGPKSSRGGTSRSDAAPTEGAGQGELGKLRAALAGLSAEAAAVARATLAAEGCEAISCRGADDLLARLRDGACALVLADAHALGLGAGELTRRIKSISPQALVLLFSRDGSAEAPVEALRAGARDYFLQPVRSEELRARLREALASRRLGQELRQRALQLAFVTELSEAISASLDLRAVLGTAVGGLRALVDFDLAAVVFRLPAGGGPREPSGPGDSAGQVAQVRPLTPDAEALWPPPARVPLADSVLARDFEGNRPRVVGDLARQQVSRDLAALRDGGYGSLLLLPLAARGATIAAVVLASRRPDAFAEGDLDLLQHVAGHLSSAVVNAHLYGELMGLSARLEDAVRQRTREALEVKQYLESLLETAGDAVITADLEGRITSWNSGARQILGYGRDEALGRDICLLASGEAARDQLSGLVQLTLGGQGTTNVETVWLRKDRKEVSVSLTVSPIVGAAAKLAGVLVIARDVTERKRLQDELFHSEKLASVGQLAAGVAHQINNPLGAISGRAQMLLRLSGPPEEDFLREQLAKIRADCARIADTVNDLLGFARKTDTAKQHTSVNVVLDETVEMVSHGLAAQRVRVERRYASNLPPILASANHLRQLFANLMTNAFDAMPEGGTLTITSVLRPAEGDRSEPVLEVSFADTGVGIAPEDLPRIFEPFFTTKPPGQGTGLGLAVARRIVDFHNGRIDVESSQGAGTTFTVQFPVG